MYSRSDCHRSHCPARCPSGLEAERETARRVGHPFTRRMLDQLRSAPRGPPFMWCMFGQVVARIARFACIGRIRDRVTRRGIHPATTRPGASREVAPAGCAPPGAPTIASMNDDPLAPFRWHPEPELIGIRDADASRAALERAGEATWAASLDWLYGEAMVRTMGLPTGYAELRRAYFGEQRGARPGPGRPGAAPGGARRVRDEDRAPHAEQLPPARAQLLHAAAAGRLDRRRGARPVDQPGRRRLARGPGRGVRRGGGRSLAVRSRRLRRGQLRPPGLGRRDGQLHRDGAGPRRPPPRGSPARPARHAARRSRASASTPATRPTSRSRGRSTSSASRPRRSSSSPPTTGSASTPRRSPTAIARDRAAGHRPVAIAAVAGSTNTGSVDLVPELASLARGEGLWLHVDAAYGGAARLSTRDAGRVPGLDLADSVTIDPHKWFFQAYDVGALVVRDGRHLRQAFDRSPEYYRGGEAPGHRTGRRRPPTPTRAS